MITIKIEDENTLRVCWESEGRGAYMLVHTLEGKGITIDELQEIIKVLEKNNDR